MNQILILLLMCMSVAADAMSPPRCVGGTAPRRLLAFQGHGSGKAAASTVTGRLRAVTLFARFADEDSGSHTLPSWTARIFDPDRQGSVTHYYGEMSAGQFELAGHVIPQWFASRQPASHYVADDPGGYGRFGHFVTEILDAADPVVDFALFDNDGPDGVPNSGDDDGYVDFLFINTKSAPAGFIRGPATGIAILGIFRNYVTDDAAANGGFITFRRDEHSQGIGGITQRASTYAEAVGTMAHEFGHALGLPDLFDATFSPDGEDDSAGIGYWGVMGHGNRGWQERGGPTPFCAWSLEQLGWIGSANADLKTVHGLVQSAPLQDPRNGGSVYRIPSRGNSIYYLVEYRSPVHSYYDRHLPRAGVLVWQINDNRTGNQNESNKLVDLISADGLYADRAFPGGQPSPFAGSDNLDFWAHNVDYRETHAGNLGDATDLFDGDLFREYSPTTNPASQFGVTMSNLRVSGDGMVADLNANDRRWAGPIEAEAVWRDTVELTADVTVKPGASLVIKSGTVVLVGQEDQFAAGEDPLRTELIIAGDLLCGSTHGEAVIFTSAASDKRPGDWSGIRVMPTGLLRLENTNIDYAVSAVQADNVARPLFMAQVRIDHSDKDGVLARGVHASLLAREIQVRRSGGFALVVSGEGELRVEGSRFLHNRSGGILRTGGRLTLTDSEFTDHPAHVIARKTNGTLQRSSFAGGEVGLHLADTTSLVVTGSRFVDLATGIVAENSMVTVISSDFIDVSTMGNISGGSSLSQFSLNVVEGSQVLLSNASSRVLQAAHNWWGPAEDGPVETRMLGEINWQPQLLTDPRTPANFGLQGSFPNPFNSSVTIEYSVGVDEVVAARDGQMWLEIFDVAGQRVRALSGEPAASGSFQAVWDARNDAGKTVGSGVYFYRLRVGSRVDAQRMTLLR